MRRPHPKNVNSMASSDYRVYVEQFIDSLRTERNFSQYTLTNYRIDLLQLLGFIKEKERQLFAIDRASAREFLYFLEKRKYGRRSLARKISAIRSFFRFLVREMKTKANPFVLISTPKLQKKLPNFLYLTEMEKLLDAPDVGTFPGKRDRAMIELLYGSGIRVSEATKLNLSDMDLNSGEIRVFGKGRKERIVLIGKYAISALKEYLSARGKPETRAVFLNQRGGRFTERSVERMIKSYAKKAGLENRSLRTPSGIPLRPIFWAAART